MRAVILVLFALGIVAHAPSAKAGLSETPREISAPADDTVASTSTDEANQQSEDQLRLTKNKRRDVQRGLARLGFDAKATGKFDDQTRDAISRWQDQHGYPKTGFLNTAQHQALLNESADAAEDSKSGRDERRRGGHTRHARGGGGIGGPIGAIGHVVGGIFGR
jgi:peptidoglycan hydrolase-like protein with peptidoglycan-binding domain